MKRKGQKLPRKYQNLLQPPTPQTKELERGNLWERGWDRFILHHLKITLKNPKLPKSGCWKSLFRCHVQIEGSMVSFLCLWQLHIISSIQTHDCLIKQGSSRQWWVGKIQIWSSPYFPPNLIPSVKCTPNRSPSHVWRRAAWSSTFVHCYLHTFPWGQDVKFTPTPVFSKLTQFSFREAITNVEDKFSVLCNKIWIAGKKNRLDFKSREMTRNSHFPISWY